MWENKWSAPIFIIIADGGKGEIAVSLSPQQDPLHHQQTSQDMHVWVQKFIKRL